MVFCQMMGAQLQQSRRKQDLHDSCSGVCDMACAQEICIYGGSKRGEKGDNWRLEVRHELPVGGNSSVQSTQVHLK